MSQIKLEQKLKNTFNKQGFISLKGVFDKARCSLLHSDIEKTRKIKTLNINDSKGIVGEHDDKVPLDLFKY